MIPILAAVVGGGGDEDAMNAPHNSIENASSIVETTKHLTATILLFMLNISMACLNFDIIRMYLKYSYGAYRFSVSCSRSIIRNIQQPMTN